MTTSRTSWRVALAAYDDIIAAGQRTPPEELERAIDPALLPDWTRFTAFLSLLEKAWPRTDGGSDSQMEEPAHLATDGGTRTDDDSGTVAKPEPATTVDGGHFGRFQIMQTLGKGGFGIVFLAWDPALRRQVALKVPQPETLMTPDARKRFEREAQAAAGLDHPNIVPIYESGCVGTVSFISAAYCPGPTLEQWLVRQSQPVPVRDAADLVATLARAVEHAHDRGVLHRDLKPSNILLQRRGADGPDHDEDNVLAGFEPRITDFSLAKIADGLGPETKTGVPFGSPPYMAPEQAEGKQRAIGPPVDVYGLGTILYELLTGTPPFGGESQLDILRQVIADDPLPPGRRRNEVPPELEAITLKCLRKTPEGRYRGPRELAEEPRAVLEWRADPGPTAKSPGAAGPIDPPAPRRHSCAGDHRTFAGRALDRRVLVPGPARRVNGDHEPPGGRGTAPRPIDRRARYAIEVQHAARLIRENHDIRQAESILDRWAMPSSFVPDGDLRGFEWGYLKRQAHRELMTLRHEAGEVYCARFSPNGQWLLTAGQDGTARVWDAQKGSVHHVLRHSGEVNWADFAPDGRSVATAGDAGAISLWDLATGLRVVQITHAHRGEVELCSVHARWTSAGLGGSRRRACALGCCHRESAGALQWRRRRHRVARPFGARIDLDRRRDGNCSRRDPLVRSSPSCALQSSHAVKRSLRDDLGRRSLCRRGP